MTTTYLLLHSYRHHSGTGSMDTIVTWVAHAAVWRLVSRLPTPLLLFVAVAAMASWSPESAALTVEGQRHVFVFLDSE